MYQFTDHKPCRKSFESSPCFIWKARGEMTWEGNTLNSAGPLPGTPLTSPANIICFPKEQKSGVILTSTEPNIFRMLFKHTVILEYFNIKEQALSNFALQSFQIFIGTQNKKNFSNDMMHF